MMYYNMPPYIVSNLYTPSRLFPGRDDKNDKERFPEMSKIINYFQNSPNDIPSLILIEIEINDKKRINIGCFSNKSWNENIKFNRQKEQNKTNNRTDGDLDDFDPLKLLKE